MLIQFQKSERVRHLGLLDLQRTMQRALRRSGLPVAYSNGFNPHIVMSFASALSSGIPGDAELLDVGLNGDVTEDECKQAMNRVLPPSLSVSRVRLVDSHFPKVTAALVQCEYVITLSGEGSCAVASAIPAFLAETEIMALRKTKRSEVMVNIRPMIHELKIEETDEVSNKVRMTARVSFTEAATLKPQLLMETLCTYAQVDMPRCAIRRTKLLGEKEGGLVPLIDL